MHITILWLYYVQENNRALIKLHEALLYCIFVYLCGMFHHIIGQILGKIEAQLSRIL